MANNSTTIQDFENGVLSVFTSQLALLSEDIRPVTVGKYDRPGKSIACPAVYFETTGIDPYDGTAQGTGQLAVTFNLSAYAIVAYNHDNAKLAVRKLTEALMFLIHDNQWNVPCTPAELVTSVPDNFVVEPGGSGNGNQQAYEVFRIDWTQDALIGSDVWAQVGIMPGDLQPYLGYAPNIGVDNKDKYIKV